MNSLVRIDRTTTMREMNGHMIRVHEAMAIALSDRVSDRYAVSQFDGSKTIGSVSVVLSVKGPLKVKLVGQIHSDAIEKKSVRIFGPARTVPMIALSGVTALGRR